MTTKKLTTEEFIKKAKEVHGDKYDYSRVNYVNYQTKIEIICPKHGSFKQTPGQHFRGQGCPDCGKQKLKEKGEKQRLTTEEFVKKAKEVHGDKYDYSKVNYINAKTKIEIICPKHGSFFQTPTNHLSGDKCPKCAQDDRSLKRRLTTEEFAKKAKEIHGDRYDYSKVNYINNHTKIEIICPKHGSFFQTPMHHISENQNNSCPKCRESKGERKIRVYLEAKRISYNQEFIFKDCCGKAQKPLPFDFYIPSKNLLIEYQGVQHYKPIDYFGGNKNLLEQKERDDIKKCFAKNKKIKLLTIPYWDYKIIEEILEENL